MISVVMANYNGERYIANAIQSVLDQQFQDFEFIVVDDGSTDRSPQIIQDFERDHPQRMRAICETENCGQAAAFNLGIAASAGEIVSFIDSDDVWFPAKLARVDEAFVRNPEIALHQHNLFVLRDETMTGDRIRDVFFCGDYFRHTQQSREIPLFAPTTGLSTTRRVLDEVLPIPSQLRTCADGFLTRTCFCYGETASTAECLGAYRVHRDNNIFENAAFDVRAYLDELLLPVLQAYYLDHNIDMSFDRPISECAWTSPPTWPDKLLDLSIRNVLNYLGILGRD